jgi:hypothetical protein
MAKKRLDTAMKARRAGASDGARRAGTSRAAASALLGAREPSAEAEASAKALLKASKKKRRKKGKKGWRSSIGQGLQSLKERFRRTSGKAPSSGDGATAESTELTDKEKAAKALFLKMEAASKSRDGACLHDGEVVET